ncbi:indole-3-glycerol phosphate synthase TrpC [Peribacillus sp. SCS-155]|uniref:indole-3-glycerol phosphate synthase TrpC n=1 Tax=Peribacillus sedimenti TaxID=3115297 RepID=UPI003905B558
MEDILKKIITVKEAEVAELKAAAYSYEEPAIKATRTMYEAIKNAEAIGIIAEIKRASPSKGDIFTDVNPTEQAKTYERFGASAISVLTDETFFKGTIEDLQKVRGAVQVPLLCKDFIIDEIQIKRAMAAGANVILLIAAALDQERLAELYSFTKGLGLESIIEVHDEYELERAIKLNPQLIGVNNRNLKNFTVDLAVTERLAKALGSSSEALLISESGIKTREDILRVKAAGASAVLVGESLMAGGNPEAKLKEFQLL